MRCLCQDLLKFNTTCVHVLYEYSLTVAFYPTMRWISASSAAATCNVDVVVIISNIDAVYRFIHG